MTRASETVSRRSGTDSDLGVGSGFTGSGSTGGGGGDEYAAVMDDQGKTALTLDGGKAGVRSVAETDRKELVYDFVVEGLNVMFVNGIAAEGFSLS